MFILLDTDLDGLTPYFEYIDGLDDKPIFGYEAVNEYAPDGPFHIVDTYENLDDASRWTHLWLASLGVRIFTDRLTTDYPTFSGPVPPLDKIRKISVDGINAETRAVHFAKFGVHYIGRTKLSPRNVFILDNKKGNALHDPSKDATLEALYASLPDDWWGSCGFVSSGNVERLEAFMASDDMASVIPIGYTTGATAKLKFMGLDYVDALVPNGTPQYGVRVRDEANRLSYDLSLVGQPEIEKPEGKSWLEL